MDLLPDDSSDIKKAKSVMRWDAKRKKYLPTMVTVDGKALKGQRRNESGKKVKGEAQKSIMARNEWALGRSNTICFAELILTCEDVDVDEDDDDDDDDDHVWINCGNSLEEYVSNRYRGMWCSIWLSSRFFQ